MDVAAGQRLDGVDAAEAVPRSTLESRDEVLALPGKRVIKQNRTLWTAIQTLRRVRAR
jgi:hypothetical protein